MCSRARDRNFLKSFGREHANAHIIIWTGWLFDKSSNREYVSGLWTFDNVYLAGDISQGGIAQWLQGLTQEREILSSSPSHAEHQWENELRT